MFKKIKIILLLLCLTTIIGLMSNTYSRYVASAKSDINAQFSKWQILVDNLDIASGSQTAIDITPVIENNEYVADNTFAPSSKGYFDINIDPTNVDVSFNYNVNLNLINENMPDILISKYAIIPNSYTEGDNLEITYIEDGKISNTLFFNKTVEGFRFESFTIRVFFEWYEGIDNTMSDVEDTNIAYLAVNENLTLQMNANIQFEQLID